MRDIQYKTYPIGSPGVWRRGTLSDLVKSIPVIALYIHQGILVDHDDLNAILRAGSVDAGMSGGGDWQSFEIKEDEYYELLLDLMTEQGSNFTLPSS